MQSILTFDDVCLDLHDDDGRSYNLLDHISFSIEQGKAVGVVGESGCGKSMTSLAAMKLLPPAARIESGSIRFFDTDLVGKTEKEMYSIRGKEMAMIFQEPMTSLNPVLTIGFQIQEMIQRHERGKLVCPATCRAFFRFQNTFFYRACKNCIPDIRLQTSTPLQLL